MATFSNCCDLSKPFSSDAALAEQTETFRTHPSRSNQRGRDMVNVAIKVIIIVVIIITKRFTIVVIAAVSFWEGCDDRFEGHQRDFIFDHMEGIRMRNKTSHDIWIKTDTTR